MEIARHDRIHGYGMGIPPFLLPLHTQKLFTRSAASWIGLFTAQQYTASKHGVLGLMRSLDSVLAGEDIRIACIHPWFTGKPKKKERTPRPFLMFALQRRTFSTGR
jgi:NAD(P)-dependent dehydrogenase (short-subunit alcohol dehydrogenase family)